MKKAISILCLAIAMIMITLILTSCGNSLNGSYKIVEFKQGDMVMNSDELDSFIQQSGAPFSFTVNGYSATLVYGGRTQLLTIDPNTNIMTDENGKYPVPYTFDGRTLTISQSGITMVFEKE